jgi:hypothetical protein
MYTINLSLLIFYFTSIYLSSALTASEQPMDGIKEDTYAMDPALFLSGDFPPNPKPDDLSFL